MIAAERLFGQLQPRGQAADVTMEVCASASPEATREALKRLGAEP